MRLFCYSAMSWINSCQSTTSKGYTLGLMLLRYVQAWANQLSSNNGNTRWHSDQNR